MRCWLLLIVLFVTGVTRAQDGMNEQQLRQMLLSPQPDSTRIDIYNELCWPVLTYNQPDSAIHYGRRAIDLARVAGDEMREAVAHRRLGITYINANRIQEAIHEEEDSYRLSEELGFKRGMQLALNNIGVAYLNNEFYSKALTFFLRSLSMIRPDDHSAATSLYANCGMIYRRTNDLERSKAFFLKALAEARQQPDENLKVIADCNMSTACRLLDQLDSCGIYLREAAGHLGTDAERNARFNYELSHALYQERLGNTTAALEGYTKALAFANVLGDEITALINIAEAHVRLGHLPFAINVLKDALNRCEKARTFDNLAYITRMLADIYERQGNYKAFAEMIHRHLAYADSNQNLNKSQQMLRQQLAYDYTRRQVADSIRFEQRERMKNLELENAEARLHREKSFRVSILIAMLLILIIAVVVFNRFLVVRSQKNIIEQQKQLVEVKNRETMDSINYAWRLQAAILPQPAEIRKHIDFELMYVPRDIIGGDFYFFERHHGHLYIAVCDCTGHGIPGAIMSVVCHEALEKSILHHHLTDPAEILGKTRELVIDSLNADQQKIRDGMDCSLLVIRESDKALKWAGANNSLWVMTDGTVTEIKADKQHVGAASEMRPFTTHELNFASGTFLYFYTDGYADQFGGPKGKKYKSSFLRQFITGLANLSTARQVTLLQRNFQQWKGDHDQVDDVTVGVLRIT